MSMKASAEYPGARKVSEPSRSSSRRSDTVPCTPCAVRRCSATTSQSIPFAVFHAAGSVPVSSSLLATAILDTRPPDLLVAREIRGHRLRTEREILLHELVAPVLARRLD